MAAPVQSTLRPKSNAHVVARKRARLRRSMSHSAAADATFPVVNGVGSMIVGSLTGGVTRNDWSRARRSTRLWARLFIRAMRPSLARRQQVSRSNCQYVSSFSRGQQLRDVS